MSLVPSLFIPLVTYGLYLPFFPWFVGEFIRGEESEFGLFFLQGVWLRGEMIRTLEGWWFGIFDVVFLYFPLVFFLAHKSSNNPDLALKSNWGFNFFSFLRLVIFFGFLNLLKTSRDLGIWYHWIAFFFSPVKTWWALLVFWMAFWKKKNPPKIV